MGKFKTAYWLICVLIAGIAQPAISQETKTMDGDNKDLVWGDNDREATGHVLGQAANVQTLTLDLSDPKNAHFLKRHYEIAGMTADRYPGLHALMDEHKDVHAKQGVTLATEVKLSDNLVYTDLGTIMLTLYPTNTASNYAGSAAASMAAAADDPTRDLQISYTSLCFYDVNNNPIGTCATDSSFGSGQYFPVNHNVTTADQAFTGAFSATYYDTTNKRYVAQISTLTLDTIDYPQTQTISDPVIVHSTNDSLKTALVCTSRSVNANANPGTCDYGTYSSNNVLVTMEGSVTYKAGQTPKVDGNGHLVGTGSVSLINTVQGGNCRLAPTISGVNFFSQPQVTYNAALKTLAWNFDNLDFGSASALICGGDGTSVQYSLTLQVDNDADADNKIVASQLSQTNTVTPHFLGPDAGALATPMLRLVAGCLHPDTLIAMAGEAGSQAISKFTGEGEKIISMGGIEEYVIGTVEGDEATMFTIAAGEALNVKASAMHPFIMADGSWRAAEDLKEGDRVLSSAGPVALTSVKEVKYGGPVYNLMLARTADALHPDTGSFYANGFLVGGHDAQQKLAAAKLADPGRVEPLVPDQFTVDYASHLEDHSKR